MIFSSYEAAVLWAVELMHCPIKAVNYDPDRIFGSLTTIGQGYLTALDIKVCTEKAAMKWGAYDDRGNYILLHLLPSNEEIHWREWQKRKRDNAIEELKELLERKGYLVL